MQTLTIEEAGNSEPRLPAGSRADHARLVTLYTDDQLFSDPSLRRGVIGRNAFNRRLDLPPRNKPNGGRTDKTGNSTTGRPSQRISLVARRVRYGNSPRWTCQLRDIARWASCAQ